ncbi:gamma-aminobutyric acid type B receptor subunit 1-like [Hydractinia symbiolongicarpus]|uniref:gamma-aminobutyric acid type B receptor subunit 1-like n=1 Tax=Hydractinia symbiolongicarpus TaxID=13093 RepID=UPI00254B1EAB|nr:gamma-aminobutyric acid type B receptor subunit 1-like [Hydractinia symbiolongicarpus]
MILINDKRLEKFTVIVLTLSVVGRIYGQKEKLYIGALIPKLYSFDEKCHHTAIKLATNFINNDSNILNDYTLEIIANQTAGGLVSGFSFISFFDMIKRNITYQVFLGPDTTTETRGIGFLTAKYKLPQISYSGLAQVFDVSEGNDDFEYFVKIVPSPISYQMTNLKLLQHFGWNRVAIAYEVGHVDYFREARSLSNYFKANQIEVVAMYGVSRDVLDPIEELQAMEDADVKIVFGVFARFSARNFFCEMYKQKVHRKYQLILTRQLPDSWIDNVKSPDSNNCTSEEYLTSADGFFTFSRSSIRRDNKLTVANRTASEIWEMIKEEKRILWKQPHSEPTDPPTPPPHHFNIASLFAFDAIYMFATALDRIVREHGREGLLDGTRDSVKAKRLEEEMLKSNFQGATGHVAFNRNLDDERLGGVVIQQYRKTLIVKENNKTSYIARRVNIGQYEIAVNRLTFLQNETELFKGKVISYIL